MDSEPVFVQPTFLHTHFPLSAHISAYYSHTELCHIRMVGRGLESLDTLLTVALIPETSSPTATEKNMTLEIEHWTLAFVYA